MKLFWAVLVYMFLKQKAGSNGRKKSSANFKKSYMKNLLIMWSCQSARGGKRYGMTRMGKLLLIDLQFTYRLNLNRFPKIGRCTLHSTTAVTGSTKDVIMGKTCYL